MFNLKVALRFLIHKPIKTLMALLAIAAGSAIFYFILNVSDGLKRLVLSITAESNSHIYVTGNFEFNGYDSEDIIEFRNYVFSLDQNITDISFSQIVGGTLNNEEKSAVNIKGIDFEYGAKIHQIGSRITDKKVNNFPSNDHPDTYDAEVVIGRKLAEKLGFKDADKALGKIFRTTINGKTYKFKIVATFYSDQFELSLQTIFTTLESVQKITNSNIANVIDIRTKDPLDSANALNNIKSYLYEYNPDINIAEWQEGNGYAVNAIYIENVSILIIQTFTALAISFGLASILTFNVREKISQIGILKAMGINNRDAQLIFTYYALILTIIGLFLGLFLGNFLSNFFMTVFKRPSGVVLVNIRNNLKNVLSLITFVIMGTSNLLAAITSINTAKNLKIIEVIKNE